MCCFSYLMRQTQNWKDVHTQRVCYSRYLNIFWFSKKNLIVFRKFLLKSSKPAWFKYKSLPPRCLTFILLLFIVSIFSYKRCFIGCLTVICALPSSVRYIGVDIKPLDMGKLPFTRAFNFKRLSRTVCDGKFLASFVPTCKIMLLGFFWIIGIR